MKLIIFYIHLIRGKYQYVAITFQLNNSNTETHNGNAYHSISSHNCKLKTYEFTIILSIIYQCNTYQKYNTV